jgi:hypothetical protein
VICKWVFLDSCARFHMYDFFSCNSVGHRSCSTQHIGFQGNVFEFIDLGRNPKRMHITTL